jgi:cell wall-associated NlpC family hydrolase
MTELENQQRDAVVAEALSWLGTGYHHNAAIKGVGVDCARILVEVYGATGMMPPIDLGDYPKDWHLHRDEERYLLRIADLATPTNAPKKGDIALYRFGRTVSHSAIVIDDNTVLHAFHNGGVILSERDGAELRGRLFGYWSLWSNKE